MGVGVDILNRLMKLMKKYGGDLPVSYTPEGKVDEGIPDNWGQAAVYGALIEGLAGVTDNSILFRDVQIAPRWMAANKDTANVTVAYGPAEAFVQYSYLHSPEKKFIDIEITGDIDNGNARILLPPKSTMATAFVNGKKFTSIVEEINQSKYAVIAGWKGKDIKIRIAYK
ncbi:hypothetical protein BH20BAC1_BH20BAC1_08350 [soil metagenome]